MEVICSQERRGRGMKLSFSIIFKRRSNENEKITEVFSIDNLAEVRFRFVGDYNGICTFLSLKKHYASAKDSAVKVDVKCVAQKYSQQWVPTKHWIEWQEMGSKRYDTTFDDNCYIFVVVPINIIVTEEKSFNAENFYEDDEFTDFHLATAGGRVAIHRVLLAAHSEVFKMMLRHEWKEKTEGCIQIEGVTLQTLKHLKEYIYLGTLPDDGLKPLLLIARCYLIDSLKSKCISKLAQTATSENLEELLNFANDKKIMELTLAILELTPDNVVHGAYQLKKKQTAEKK